MMYLTTKNAGECPPVAFPQGRGDGPQAMPVAGSQWLLTGCGALGSPWHLVWGPAMGDNPVPCPEFDRHELLIYEEVARMPPFRRKTLVLIGAQGVGRRSLKNKLIMSDQARYGTTIPCECPCVPATITDPVSITIPHQHHCPLQSSSFPRVLSHHYPLCPVTVTIFMNITIPKSIPVPTSILVSCKHPCPP